jgi:peptide/nickel transport system substrate-binding protein
MNGIRKTSAIVVCACMIMTALFVLPGTSEQSEAAALAPITLTVGVTQSPDNLNPFAGYLSISYQVYMLMYDMLVGVDKDLNPCPQLAASWNHSTDGKIWNYTLVRNAKWHDGTPITANDIAFTYNLIIDHPGPCALYTDYLRNVTSVVALDDYTVQITTDVPKATMLSIIAPILPQHLWSTIPAAQLDKVDQFDTRIFPNGPVGSGPFILDSYAVDDFVKFTKFANYYGGTVHFDELIYKVFLDTEAMLNALQAGQIDVACDVPPNAWTTVLGWDNVDGQAVKEIVMTELGLNVCPVDMRYAGASTNYELLNRSVRKAMAMAINKTDLVQNVFYNLGTEGDTLIASASAYWHYNVTPAEKYNFNITRANQILDAAGYIDTDSDGIRENSTSGAELSFLFNVILSEPDEIQAGTRIMNWLQQIGIYAPPQAISEDSLITQWIGMKYDMYIWGWGGDADPSFLLSVMTTDQIPDSKNDWSAWSDCFYSNPYYDQLYIQQQNTIDPAARQAIVHEMQRILYLDSPYIILQNAFGKYAYRTDRFTNWPDMVAHPGMTPFSGWTGGCSSRSCRSLASRLQMLTQAATGWPR